MKLLTKKRVKRLGDDDLIALIGLLKKERMRRLREEDKRYLIEQRSKIMHAHS